MNGFSGGLLYNGVPGQYPLAPFTPTGGVFHIYWYTSPGSGYSWWLTGSYGVSAGIAYYIDYQDIVSYCPAGYNAFASTCALSPNTPDPQKNTDKPNCGLGNPCNAGTGNKYQSETDYAGVGTYPLHAERIYNSGGVSPSAVEATAWGSQWRGTYDRSIVVNTGGGITTATIKREGGKQYYFNLVNGTWVGDADIVGALVRLTNASGVVTGWTYTNENDETETYDPAGKFITIANRAGLTQTLTYSDGTSGANGGYVLDATGTPTATALPAGRLIRVTDPAGRTLQFGYDAIGRVVKMTDPAGGIYLYGYSGPLSTDNLTSVTYPGGKIRQYLYGETANVSATPDAGVSYTHSLTGIVDENSTRYASWTYDAQGRATSSEHGASGSGIDHVGLAYGAPDASGNSTTTVTDPRGNARSYGFTTTLGVVRNTGITGLPCNGCNAALAYDANGNVASRTGFNGNTTCYAYDLARNLETVRLEGLPTGAACPADLAAYAPSTAVGSIGRKITTQWSAAYRLPAAVAEPMRITGYNYDAQGNLMSKAIQPTADTTGGAGLSALVAGTPRTSNYTYNGYGQVHTADGPRTDVADITTYTYYPIDATCTGAALGCRGQLATVSNALGQVTTLGDYDAHGHPGTITDPNGLITSLLYDARGRLTSRSTGGETTGYEYDGAGQLITVTPPNMAATRYTYDAAHRLTGIADALGNHINYSLDNMGNRTQEQIFDSTGNLIQTHSRVFDALNRLWKDIGAINQTTLFEYDANGNLSKATDPLVRPSTYSYDALERLITSTDAANGITRFGYDGLDQLTKVTDPKTLVTQYQKDGLGNLEQLTSPDTGITVNTFDEAGNLKTRTDAKGQVSVYTYDALNRLTDIAYKPNSGANATHTVAYRYDLGVNGIGHLTQITDSTGTATYSYDLLGRLTGDVRQAQGLNYNTGFGYDTQGRLDTIAYPSGRMVNYTFDNMGRINQISTTLNNVTQILASNVTYEPFGDIHSFNYGDGVTAPVQSYTRSRDQDGRIASYILKGKAMSIGYDDASQINSITDPQYPQSPASYGYDPLSRLNSYIQGASAQSYYYDANGNRSSQILGSTTDYSYVPGSNRLAGIQVNSGAIQAVVQDVNGSTTSDPTRQYSYDLRGRLVQVTTAQGSINYEVNALGHRVRKQVPYAQIDTLYHYDTQGRLIGESPVGSAQFTREYIYLGDQPVAVMK